MPACQVLELKRALYSPERRSNLDTVTQAAGKGPGWPRFTSQQQICKRVHLQRYLPF